MRFKYDPSVIESYDLINLILYEIETILLIESFQTLEPFQSVKLDDSN